MSAFPKTETKRGVSRSYVLGIFMIAVALSLLFGGSAGSAPVTLVYGSTWRWFKQGTSFCVQQTPEQAINVFCNASAQTEMNNLMIKLSEGDIVDFHRVPITTTFQINNCSRTPCTGTGLFQHQDLTFRNAFFQYSGAQILTLTCSLCVAAVTPSAIGMRFESFTLNMTGRIAVTDSVSVSGFTGAQFLNWNVCCGTFQLTEDTNSVGASVYSGWSVSNTGIGTGTNYILQISDLTAVKNSNFIGIDNGINQVGAETQIATNVFQSVVGICVNIVDSTVSQNTFVACGTAVNVYVNIAQPNGDPSIIGNTFTTNGINFATVAGVNPLLFGNLVLNGAPFNPTGTFPITVTASPFTFTDVAFVLETVYINGGTIVTIVKNGITIFGASTGDHIAVDLYPGQSIIVTYTIIPGMTVDEF